jgi:hypothetical protein
MTLLHDVGREGFEGECELGGDGGLEVDLTLFSAVDLCSLPCLGHGRSRYEGVAPESCHF